MSNLYEDMSNYKIIGNLPRYHIEIYNGMKIGFFGLAEEEWHHLINPRKVPETLVHID